MTPTRIRQAIRTSGATIGFGLFPIEVNIYVQPVTSAEFKRWRQGASFEPAKGGHIWVMLRGRRAILPMHGSRQEMKSGTIAAIKKQLGLT